MNIEYKRICSIEGVSSGPVGQSGIRLDLAINRDLTPEEVSFISRQVKDILDHINRNTVITHPTTIESNKEEKAAILNLFTTPIYVREIPNGYSDTYPNPWFLVTTHRGVIKLGWRKRVMEIDWSESDIPVFAGDLFKDTNVSKGDKWIHANSYREADEFINKLLNFKTK